MVYWLPFNKKVYEIYYNTKKEHYSDDLPTAESIMNSFRIVKESAKPSNDKKETTQVAESTPLEILKKRFAMGEITEEDYQRMKRILQEQ
jgi:Short C-terminal domain